MALPPLIKKQSIDNQWLAQMAFFHGYSATSLTYIFHGRQFITAHVSGIDVKNPAKTTVGLVSAGIAQMSRFVCDRSAIIASI